MINRSSSHSNIAQESGRILPIRGNQHAHNKWLTWIYKKNTMTTSTKPAPTRSEIKGVACFALSGPIVSISPEQPTHPDRSLQRHQRPDRWNDTDHESQCFSGFEGDQGWAIGVRRPSVRQKVWSGASGSFLPQTKNIFVIFLGFNRSAACIDRENLPSSITLSNCLFAYFNTTRLAR